MHIQPDYTAVGKPGTDLPDIFKIPEIATSRNKELYWVTHDCTISKNATVRGFTKGWFAGPFLEINQAARFIFIKLLGPHSCPNCEDPTDDADSYHIAQM